MGKAIVIGLIIISVVIVVAGVVVYFRNKKSKETALSRGWATKGDLSKSQERAILAQLGSADILFRQLLATPTNLSDEMNILRSDHRELIVRWLGRQESPELDMRPEFNTREVTKR